VHRPNFLGLSSIIIYIGIMLLIAAGPLIGVIVRSLQKPSSRAGKLFFSLDWYRSILSGDAGQFGMIALTAIRNSLIIGIAAAGTALILGTAVSYVTVRYRFRLANLIDTLSMAPMSVSSVILGLGYFLLLRSLPNLKGASLLLIIAAHAVIAYPFVVRTVSAVLKKISAGKGFLLHRVSHNTPGPYGGGGIRLRYFSR